VPPTRILIFFCVTVKNCAFFCVTFEILHSFVTPEYVCIMFVHVAFYLKRFDKWCSFISLLVYFSYTTHDVLRQFVCITIYILPFLCVTIYILTIRLCHYIYFCYSYITLFYFYHSFVTRGQSCMLPICHLTYLVNSYVSPLFFWHSFVSLLIFWLFVHHT